MQYDRYPFIDLAVHDAIRERFADGDALIVASPDLRTVHWANGQASDLFGYADIYELLEDGLETQPALKRQIGGALIGLARKSEQEFMIRVTRGFRRMAIGARASLIELPGGAPAVLIACDGTYVGRTEEARGKQIISGFEGTDTHVAVLNAEGRLVAASPSFVEAEIDSGDLSRMVRDVSGESDRLVKRMVGTPRGPIPAAIGQLTDNPVLHLVFAIEPATAQTEDDISSEAPSPAAPVAPVAPVAPIESSTAAFDANRIRHELAENSLKPRAMEDDGVPTVFREAQEIETPDIVTELPAADSSADIPEAGAEGANADSNREEIPAEDENPAKPEADKPLVASAGMADETVRGSDFEFDPTGRPVRFVWKIDREGAFCEVSPEFAEAVGPHAADIIGRRFPDIARVFNLDPDHEITELLNRRDTWSGRTVNWPVEGTNLVVPVDLAALPTYTRERRFDGFRGFGIVRLGEARADDQGIGLALVPGPWTGPFRKDLEQGSDAAVSGPSPLEDVHPGDDAPLQDNNEHQPEKMRDDGEDAGTGKTGTGKISSGHDMPYGMMSTPSGTDDAATSGQKDAPSTSGSDETSDHSASRETETSADKGNDKASEDDPFRGEKPALSVTPTAGRRETDKVIDLEARRARARDTLTPLEQAAFREIGQKLGSSLGEDPAGSKTDNDKGTAAEEDNGKTEEPTGVTGAYASALESGVFNADGDSTDHEAFRDMQDDAAEMAGDDASLTDEATEAGTDRVQEIAEDEEPVDPASGSSDSAGDENHPDHADHAEAEAGPAADRSAETGTEASRFAAEGYPSTLNEAIVDMIPAALLVHVGDRLIHANQEFLDLSGYASLSEIAEAGGLDELLAGPESDELRGAMVLRRADGEELPVNARLRSINWHDGNALMLALTELPETVDSASPQDLSESTAEQAMDEMPDQDGDGFAALETAEDQSETEARLKDLEVEAGELRSILETATDGVVIIGHDNRIRSMNGSAQALFGYQETETRDQPFAMLFAHESQRAVMDYLNGLAEHGVSSVLNDGREVIGHEANGGTLPLFMTIGRLSGSQGYCAVMRDITQWKRNEEELREAKRAAETANSHKSDFLARVSHEIRTPLNAIIGFSEMMVEERFGPIGSPRYLEYARDIGSSGKHVLDIVNDLLDISKIEAGQVELDFAAVSLNDQLAECVAMLQPMANSQRVIIRSSLSTSVPEVVADGRSIKQIALNLLSNAVRYTPSGGQIVVSTAYEANGNAVLRIRDTGIGMSRKELEQAMKPFGQVGASARQRGDGTGLGLPLTKALVEANRAQFDIVSAPKEGTLVTITFPSQRVLAD